MLKVVLPPFVNLTANIFQNPYTCFTLVCNENQLADTLNFVQLITK